MQITEQKRISSSPERRFYHISVYIDTVTQAELAKIKEYFESHEQVSTAHVFAEVWPTVILLIVDIYLYHGYTWKV